MTKHVKRDEKIAVVGGPSASTCSKVTVPEDFRALNLEGLYAATAGATGD
jgi:hypothetical protein